MQNDIKNEMFKNIKHKFMAICTAIGTGVVIIIFLIVFSISYTNMKHKIETSLSKTIEDYKISGGSGEQFKIFGDMTNCILIVTRNNTIVEIKRMEMFKMTEKAEIVNTIINTNKENIRIGERYFQIKTKQLNNPVNHEVVYAVYDYTPEYNGIITLVIGFSCAIAFSIWIFTLLGFLFAKQVIKPAVKAFENQKELVANVSHELKTPLTIISTDLNLIDISDKDEDTKKWLLNSKAQIDKMNNLVLEMLELSKFQSGFFKPKTEKINLSDYFESMLLSFEATCFDKNILLETKIEKDIYCSLNQDSLQKLLSILCENAIKYSPQNGKIRAGLERQKRNIKLTISNTGDGISKENIEHIFERFYKISNEENETKSFGLGLAIAKSIVDSMGGQIECFSEEGKYTMFVITLNAENKKQKKGNKCKDNQKEKFDENFLG